MTAKDDLRTLVEQLDEADAAEVLAYARWLLAERQTVTLADLPAMWRRAAADERPRD